MITHGRGYLFGIDDNEENYKMEEKMLQVAESEGDYE